jgi:hypothetical protein
VRSAERVQPKSTALSRANHLEARCKKAGRGLGQGRKGRGEKTKQKESGAQSRFHAFVVIRAEASLTASEAGKNGSVRGGSEGRGRKLLMTTTNRRRCLLYARANEKKTSVALPLSHYASSYCAPGEAVFTFRLVIPLPPSSIFFSLPRRLLTSFRSSIYKRMLQPFCSTPLPCVRAFFHFPAVLARGRLKLQRSALCGKFASYRGPLPVSPLPRFHHPLELVDKLNFCWTISARTIDIF